MRLSIQNGFHRQLVWGILAVLVTVTILLRLPMLFYGMPFDLGNVDEKGFIGCALNYGAAESLEPIMTWYPAFYTYVLAAAFGGFYLFSLIFSDISNSADFAVMFLMFPGKFHFVGRIISLVFSVSCVLLMYTSGKQYQNETTGVIAAALFSFSTTVLIRTSWALPDSTYLLLTILSVFLLLKFIALRKMLWLLWSGIFCGLAIATKYNVGTLLVVGVSGIALTTLSSVDERSVFHKLLLLIRTKELYLYGVFIGLGFAIGSPYFLVDIYTHLAGLNWEIGRLETEASGSSTFLSQLPYLWIISEMIIREQGLGILALAGFLFGIYQCFKGDRVYQLLLPFLVISFALIGRYEKHSLRYFLPMFPALFLVTAHGMEKLFNIGKSFKVLTICFVLIAAFFSGHKLIDYSLHYTKKDTRVAAREWIFRNIPKGSKIAIGRTPHAPPLPNSRRFDRIQYSMVSEQIMSKKLPQNIKKAYAREIKESNYEVVSYIVKQSEGRKSSYTEMMADFTVLHMDQFDSQPPDYVVYSSYDRTHLTMNGYQRLFDVPDYAERLILLNAFSPGQKNLVGPTIHIFLVKDENF